MSKRPSAVIGVGIFLLLVFAYLEVRLIEEPMIRHPVTGERSLIEPDGFVRWRLVERTLAEDARPIRWIDDDNAPAGRINEWTSPVTLLGAGLSRLLRFCGFTPADASASASIWLSALTGLAAMVLLFLSGWRAGGYALGLVWIIPWPFMDDVLAVTRLGNPDHHAFHQFVFIAVAVCVLLPDKRTSAGWIAGGLTGLGLWSAGSELLPVFALLLALMAIELYREKTREPAAPFWQAWWISGLLVTAGAWLYEFWPAVWHGRVEMISPWHVALWLWAALLVQARRRLGHGPWLMLFGLVLPGIFVSLLAYRGWDASQLHVFQDPAFQRQMGVTREFFPMAENVGGLFNEMFYRYGMLPLLSLALLAGIRRQPLRQNWMFAVMVIFAVLASRQLRWADFLAPAMVLSAGLGAMRIVGRRKWIGPVIVFLATANMLFPPIKLAREIKAVNGNSRAGPHVETFVLTSMATRISELTSQRPVALAPWDCGAALAGSGKVRVVGSAYWSNLEGTQAGAEAFATADVAEFVALLRERAVDYVIIPPPERLARAISQSWMMARGMPPTREELMASVIWQVASRPDSAPRIACPEVADMQRGWQLIDARPLWIATKDGGF
jgi:hypothetical protein